MARYQLFIWRGSGFNQCLDYYATRQQAEAAGKAIHDANNQLDYGIRVVEK